MIEKRNAKTEVVDKALIGNAGEFYVMAELLRMGVVAGLTPRNARAFDILATKDNKTVKIRVKTKTKGNWQWSAKNDGLIFRDLAEIYDFTILVDLKKRNLNEMFYVIETIKIDKWLKADHQRWLKETDKNGKPHKDSPIRSLSSTKYGELKSDLNILWD